MNDCTDILLAWATSSVTLIDLAAKSTLLLLAAMLIHACLRSWGRVLALSAMWNAVLVSLAALP